MPMPQFVIITQISELPLNSECNRLPYLLDDLLECSFYSLSYTDTVPTRQQVLKAWQNALSLVEKPPPNIEVVIYQLKPLLLQENFQDVRFCLCLTNEKIGYLTEWEMTVTEVVTLQDNTGNSWRSYSVDVYTLSEYTRPDGTRLNLESLSQ